MRIDDCPAPQLVAGHVRLGVSVVGLCGGDYHIFTGAGPYTKFPRTQGHEFSATVLELAPDHSSGLRIGELVAVEPLLSCGTCYACRRGRRNCCSRLHVLGAHVDGALTEEIVVPTALAHPVGPLDAELAALVEPVSIGLQAVTRAEIASGDAVVILGAGPIGLAATLAAVDLGARVLVADIVSSRLDRAERMGAERTVDTRAADLAAEAAAFTGGDGPAVVIDATGVPALIQQAVEMVAHSGTVVVVGISDGAVTLPVLDLSRKEVTIKGSRNNAGLFDQAIELVTRYPERVRSWVTQRAMLDQVPEMLAFAIDHPADVQKILVHLKGTS